MRQPAMTEWSTCGICGKIYKPTRKDQIGCSQKCRNEAAKRREENKKTKVNKDLVEVAKMARQAGMTYGQYVASRK